MKVYIGIDWSEKKHDICYVHENGEVLRYLKISHDVEGFLELDRARQELGVASSDCLVALETAHNLLIDFLCNQNYGALYIIPPNAVKSAQGRYRQSGAKDDSQDARLIADILRTDRGRFPLWRPDSALTRQIRAKISLILFLTQGIIRHSNRLRAVLLRYYPAALQIFSSLDTLISQAFIQAFPTPQDAQKLTFEDFKLFAQQHHHTHPKNWARCYNQLQAHYPSADPDVVTAYSQEAVILTEILNKLVRTKQQALHDLQILYRQHPDHFIYTSLPAAGVFLEPALLAKLGDDRQRYLSPAALQSLAGTCPVTRQSGKSRIVVFRRGCDHEFRQIIQQWAKMTIRVSPWAEAYYRSVRPHCDSENDAVRRLANRWLAIIWKLWQDRIPYDQNYHLRQHALRCLPNH